MFLFVRTGRGGKEKLVDECSVGKKRVLNSCGGEQYSVVLCFVGVCVCMCVCLGGYGG